MVDWGILDSEENHVHGVRVFLESLISVRALTSLDEATSTFVTLATGTLAAIAIFVEGAQHYFGLATFIAMLFFWLGYSIAKMMHAVELRLMIVASFVSLVLMISFIPVTWFLFGGLPIISWDIWYLAYIALYITLIILLPVHVTVVLWRWLLKEGAGDWCPFDGDYPSSFSHRVRARLSFGLPSVEYALFAGITMFLVLWATTGATISEFWQPFLFGIALGLMYLIAIHLRGQFRGTAHYYMKILDSALGWKRRRPDS